MWKSHCVSYSIWWSLCCWGSNLKHQSISQFPIQVMGHYWVDKTNWNTYWKLIEIFCKIYVLSCAVKIFEKYPQQNLFLSKVKGYRHVILLKRTSKSTFTNTYFPDQLFWERLLMASYDVMIVSLFSRQELSFKKLLYSKQWSLGFPKI